MTGSLYRSICKSTPIHTQESKLRLRTQEFPQGLLNPGEYPAPVNSGGRPSQSRKVRVGRRKLICVTLPSMESIDSFSKLSARP